MTMTFVEDYSRAISKPQRRVPRPHQIGNRRGKNVTPDEHRIVAKQVRACLRELAKTKYELPYIKRLGFTIHTKYRGQRSFAWSYKISMDVKSLREGRTGSTEYRAINADPHIGEIKNADPETIMFMHVAHEVAHLVHSNCRALQPAHLRARTQTPHGEAWRWIYRQLRVALVNPRIAQ